MLWLRYPQTGNLAPIDARPAPGGNIVVDLAAGTYAIVSRDELTLFDATKDEGGDGVDASGAATLHYNHWVTCESPTARRLAKERGQPGRPVGSNVGLVTVDGDPVHPGTAARMEAPAEIRAQHERCPGCGGPLDPVLIEQGLSARTRPATPPSPPRSRPVSRKRRPGRTAPQKRRPERMQQLVDAAVVDVAREADCTPEVAARAVTHALRVIPGLHAALTDRPTTSSGEELPGAMVDTTGDRLALGGVIMDTTNAVLLEGLQVCQVDVARPAGSPVMPAVFAALLEGRINSRAEYSRVLYLLHVEHMAAIVAELWELAERAGLYPLLMELTRDKVHEIDADEAAARAARQEGSTNDPR